MTDFILRQEGETDWSNPIFLTGTLPITAEDAAALGMQLGPNYEIRRLGDAATFSVTDVPAQMAPPQLSGSGQTITVTPAADPASNGLPLLSLDIRFSTDETNWSIVTDAESPDTLEGLAANTQYFVQTRASNARGAGPWSNSASYTTGVNNTVPTAFTAPDWSIADLTTGGDARVTIIALPSHGGSAITRVEYRVGLGSWIDLGGITPGDYDIIGAFGDGISTEVRLRAVNAVGEGPDSDVKTVTTSEIVFSLDTTGDGELEISGATGTITVTVTSPSSFATYDTGNGPGVFTADMADVAAGPCLLAPPQVITDGSPAVGETFTTVDGLWLYETVHGAPIISRQWQSDTAGNGSFSDINDATATSYTATASVGGDDVRLVESAAQPTLGTRSSESAAVSVASTGGSGTDFAMTDSVIDTENGQVYTFAGMAIGNADPARKVVVFLAGKTNVGLTSVTVGGATATEVQALTAGNPRIAVYEAVVPTGTTGDVVVTWGSTNPSGMLIAVGSYTTGTISVLNLIDGGSGATIDLSSNVTAGATLIGLASSVGPITNFTWSGLATEEIDGEFRGTGTANLGSVAWETGVASGSPRTITAVMDSIPDANKNQGVLVEIV